MFSSQIDRSKSEYYVTVNGLQGNGLSSELVAGLVSLATESCVGGERRVWADRCKRVPLRERKDAIRIEQTLSEARPAW